MPECYLTGGDTLQKVDHPNCQGQTFRVLENTMLHFVDLQMRGPLREPEPVIQIFYADAYHKPWGECLSRNRYTVETKSGLLTTGRARFSMQPYLLETAYYYVIIVSNFLTIPGSSAYWQYDKDDATYPRGMRISSADGGATWTRHYHDDFLFAVFGDPPLPKPEPPPPIDYFALLGICFFHNPVGLTLNLPTSVPCHLWCYYTDIVPLKHHIARIIRGAAVPWGSYFCFVVWKVLEQTEPGDTLTHTFKFDEWPYCTKIVTELDLSPGEEPPFWEPWGATLTENHPWYQKNADRPVQYSFTNGIIHLFNPAGAGAGIACILDPATYPIQNFNEEPLCFTGKSPSATIGDPLDWMSYWIYTTNGDELQNLELVIARGNAWGVWGAVKAAWNGKAAIDYGLDPRPFNLLDFWKWARRQQGKSDDPTGWYVTTAYIQFEWIAPATTMDLHNDYFNLFYPHEKTIVALGAERYFTFKGEVDNIESPSIGPILKHCHPGIDLFCNLSFENYPTSPGLPPCWEHESLRAGSASYFRDEVNVQHGLYSCKVNAVGTDYVAQLVQYRWLTPYVGKTIKFTFHWFGGGRWGISMPFWSMSGWWGAGWHSVSKTVVMHDWPFPWFIKLSTRAMGGGFGQLTWDNITIEIL